MEIKIDNKGKITIPKYLRDKYNLKHGITLDISYHDCKLILKPKAVCHNCGKALTDDLQSRGSCLECPPPTRIKIY